MTTSWHLFERLADRYDETVPYFASFAAELVDILVPEPATRLLDVGTGRGAIAAAALRAGCQVTAIDAAPRMIDLVSARHPGVHALTMDAEQLGFAGDSFDVATAGFVVHLVDHPDLLLAELRRVVRAGGRVALTVPGPCAEDDRRWSTYNAVVAEFHHRAGATAPGRQVDVAESLHVAGFTKIEREIIEVHLPVRSPAAFWEFSMSHGFAGLVESLALAGATELHQRVLAELGVMQERGGIVLDRGAYVYLAEVAP